MIELLHLGDSHETLPSLINVRNIVIIYYLDNLLCLSSFCLASRTILFITSSS